jgi:superfamily I DNA/RNA helicase/RecB family exonuclease
MAFLPDAEQTSVLEHRRGALLVTGSAGTGKTAVLTERLAALIERGAHPERVALVVRTKRDRAAARAALLARLRTSLPGLKVMTVHGLAHHVVTARFSVLGYAEPPRVLTAVEQFAKVRDLLSGEDPEDWPAYGSMLPLRGFADEVRQFLLRAQEALLRPEQIAERAGRAGLSGWHELAGFYRRYLQVLDGEGAVDFAGLVEQAAVGAAEGEPLFDHLVVDDYQEATFAFERLLAEMNAASLVVAGDPESHVFSFQGTTDVPLRRFCEEVPTARQVVLDTAHRLGRARRHSEAWIAKHVSEEHWAVARELRRAHVQDHVPWSDLAVAVRRQGPNLGSLLRALDDAGVPRRRPGTALSLPAEPATFPLILALRWLARPEERDGLVESLLTTELARLSPAAARGLVRAAGAAKEPPAAALDRDDALTPEEAASVRSLREVLAEAEDVSARSVLDAFSVLWRKLPYSRRLVDAGDESAERRRDLNAVVALANAIARASELGAASVADFLDALEAPDEPPGFAGEGDEEPVEAVSVLTAHGAAGREFDSVIVVEATEGNFPSLSRPEPMFDLAVLEGPVSQSSRNRLRIEDERRLFRLVGARARRRLVFTASEPHGQEARFAGPSRFVDELGIPWRALGGTVEVQPFTVAEASASWRRALADARAAPGRRLAALDGLLALGADPARWWFQRDWSRTDRPLHEEVRTSFSKLSTLENCSLQYVLAEELGLDDRAGYQAWVGHLVHRLIEDCENGLIDRSLDALVRAATERWRVEEFPSFAVSEAFRTLVVSKMLPAWLSLYGASPALAQEVHFVFDFDGATVSGYIDRISAVEKGGSVITDYKTGRAHDVARPEENLQLGIYYLAVNRAEELARFRPVRAVELAYLKEPPKREQALPGPIAIAQLPITPKVRREYESAVEQRLSGLIGTVRELIRTETYRPNPSANCYFCRFKSLCPLFPEGSELFPGREPPDDEGAAEEAARLDRPKTDPAAGEPAVLR